MASAGGLDTEQFNSQSAGQGSQGMSAALASDSGFDTGRPVQVSGAKQWQQPASLACAGVLDSPAVGLNLVRSVNADSPGKCGADGQAVHVESGDSRNGLASRSGARRSDADGVMPTE